MGKKEEKKSLQFKILAISGLVVALFFLLMLLTYSPGNPVGDRYNSFANCIADKGAKMYGAFWCNYCKDQKSEFGDAWKILEDRSVYVECDPNPTNSQSEVCLAKNIRGYPTWEFNGILYSGKQSFDFISEKTGCSYVGEVNEKEEEIN